MPPLVSRLVRTSLAMRSQWRRSPAAIGVAVGPHERRRVARAVDPQLLAQRDAAPRVRLVGEVGHAQRDDLLGRGARRQQRLAQPRLARDERLAAEQLAQGVQPALGLAGEGLRERRAAADGGVDLVPGVVVLEDDRDLADPGQPAHGVARVGGHEVREVRRALRRRQPQPHVDVAVVPTRRTR